MMRNFFEWVDYRIENITMGERIMQNDYARIMNERDAIVSERLQPWINAQGIELADSRTIKMGYEDMLKEKDEYNNFVYSVADRNEIKTILTIFSTICCLFCIRTLFTDAVNPFHLSINKQCKRLIVQVGNVLGAIPAICSKSISS